MKKQIHIIQGIIILLIIFIALLISIKFIYKINNEQVDTSYMWNINLTNLKITEGSIEGTTKLENNTLTTEVTLKKEKEYYEFTFDIENTGTLDAIIDNINLFVDNKKNILTYKVSYLDGTSLNKGDVLKSNTNKTILVRIDYPKQTNKIYDELTLKITLSLIYKAIY